MTQYLKPFEPIPGGTIKVTASTTASAITSTSGDLPKDANVVALYNTDATIISFARLTPAASATIAVVDVDMPIPPGQIVRITCPTPGKYSIVAASGTPVVYVIPGKGN